MSCMRVGSKASRARNMVVGWLRHRCIYGGMTEKNLRRNVRRGLGATHLVCFRMNGLRHCRRLLAQELSTSSGRTRGGSRC